MVTRGGHALIAFLPDGINLISLLCVDDRTDTMTKNIMFFSCKLFL